MTMRQRVLVTGATGQQGGGTVDALLLKTGVEVFALQDLRAKFD